MLNYVGDNTDGSRYYSIKPDASTSNYMNLAGPGQSYSINLWSNPSDGNGGLWSFSVEGGNEENTSATFPGFDNMIVGQTYCITNIVEGFEGESLIDAGTSSVLGHSTDVWQPNAWRVESVTVNADKSQTVTLANAATGRFIGSIGSFTSRVGCSVSLGSTAAQVNIHRFKDAEGMAVSVDDKSIWPMPGSTEVHAGSNYDSTADAVRPMGAAWTVYPVTVYTYNCTDTEGTSLGSFVRSIAQGNDATAACPEIKNHEVKSVATDGTTINVVYERTAVTVTYDCRDNLGGIVARVEYDGKVGESYTLAAPQIEFYETSLAEPATITLTTDLTVAVNCTTEATNGVRAIAEAVSAIEGGKTYVIYDADPRGNGRNVYRYATTTGSITGSATVENVGPQYVWQIENVGTAGTYKRVKNLAYGTYIPAVSSGSVGTLAATGGNFLFTYDETAAAWYVKNASGDLYWDGNTDGTMAGWTGGQPYQLYDYYVAPYFFVTVIGVDESGNQLFSSSSFAPAGQAYTLSVPSQSGLVVKDIKGNDELDYLAANTTVTITYGKEDSAVNEIAATASCPNGIYDLQGRRLSGISRPGIYIVDGRKIRVH